MAAPPSLSSIPFSRLHEATAGFSTLLGEGATGEVFRGEFECTPIAVKRLKIPPGSTPKLRQQLTRRFQAELGVLGAFRHPRIVKLLGVAMTDDAASEHPFALTFELLDGGSLADWLRGPDGEPALRFPPLPVLARVDIALGVAAGLSYLHGLDDGEEGAYVALSTGVFGGSGGGGSGGGGGGGGGGAGAASPASSPQRLPVLHRDIKSANIGLALRAGGELYAKLLDCGLAKAVKGDAPKRRSAGASFTGGLMAGTQGYTAPELAEGATVRTEVYSLGVVLLELLVGQRASPSLARTLYEAAEDTSVEAVARERADPDGAWPVPAALALLTLALECIHTRAAKRPASVAAVTARLHQVRTLVAEGEPQLVHCGVCLEDVNESSGVHCDSAARHFLCAGCLQDHVCAQTDQPLTFARKEGVVLCATGGCNSVWAIETIEQHLDKRALVAYARAVRRAAFDAPREKREHDARMAAREATARARQAALADRVRELRTLVVDRDLTLRCPRCAAAFIDYAGCNALTCGMCGAGFCALCLADCGGDAHTHYYGAHGQNIFDKVRFERESAERRLVKLVAAVRALADEGALLQRALVAELARSDLRDLRIDPHVVLREAGVPEAVAVAAGGGGGRNGGRVAHGGGGGGGFLDHFAGALVAREGSAAQCVRDFLAVESLSDATIAELRPVDSGFILVLLRDKEEDALQGMASCALFGALGAAHCAALAPTAVPLLCQRADQGLGDSKLALAACLAIGSLGSCPVGRQAVLNEGSSALSILLQAAGLHCNSAVVSPAAAWALGCFSGVTATKDAVLLANGAAQRLFYLLDVRRDDAATAELACEALNRLCSSGTAACNAVVAALGGLAAVVVLKGPRARAHLGGASVAAAELLCVIAERSSEEGAVLEGGAVSALLSVASSGNNSSSAVLAALKSLTAVARRSAANRDAVRVAGGEGLRPGAHLANIEEVDAAAALLRAALN